MEGVILRGFNILDLVGFVGKTGKKYQATLLSQLEEKITNKEDFSLIRKQVLDAFNSYEREIVKTIFGDIDY